VISVNNSICTQVMFDNVRARDMVKFSYQIQCCLSVFFNTLSAS